jgi:hypothetical protein
MWIRHTGCYKRCLRPRLAQWCNGESYSWTRGSSARVDDWWSDERRGGSMLKWSGAAKWWNDGGARLWPEGGIAVSERLRTRSLRQRYGTEMTWWGRARLQRCCSVDNRWVTEGRRRWLGCEWQWRWHAHWNVVRQLADCSLGFKPMRDTRRCALPPAWPMEEVSGPTAADQRAPRNLLSGI